MTIVLSTPPYQQFYDNNGDPLSGGFVYTYEAGTTTPRPTYTNQGGGTPCTNPIVLDAAGRAEFWLDNSAAYKYVVQSSAGVTIKTVDNVQPFSTASGLAVLGNISANTIVGNNTGGSTTPIALTVAQVQAMLGLSPTYGAIYGFIPFGVSATTNANAAMTITAGQATDSTNAAIISGGSFSWAVSNGNAINGYQGGTTLPNSSTIHFFVCTGSSGTGSFASTSLTPTLPSGYSTSYRRVFSIPTNGSGVLYVCAGQPAEIYGGALIYFLATQVLDINVTNLGTSRTAYALTCPTGIIVEPKWRANGGAGAANSGGILLTSGNEADVAPATFASTSSWTTAPGYSMASGSSAPYPISGDGQLLTNTSAQIGARATTTSIGLQLVTRGWIDFRRS